MANGRLEVFLLNELAAHPGDLSGAKSIASVTDRTTDGKAAVDFDPQGARFVALRWTPAKPSTAIEVAEIDAFGNRPLSLFNTDDELTLYATSIPAQIRPGDGGPDLSNSLGTLAVPPVVPSVSP